MSKLRKFRLALLKLRLDFRDQLWDAFRDVSIMHFRQCQPQIANPQLRRLIEVSPNTLPEEFFLSFISLFICGVLLAWESVSEAVPSAGEVMIVIGPSFVTYGVQDLSSSARSVMWVIVERHTQLSAPSCFRSHLENTPITRLSLSGMVLMICITSWISGSDGTATAL